jgi:hypothetical protein
MQPDRQESLQERGLLSSNSEQAVIVSGGLLVIAKDAGSVWRCEEDTDLLFSPLLAHSDFCPCVLMGEHAKPEQASQHPVLHTLSLVAFFLRNKHRE